MDKQNEIIEEALNIEKKENAKQIDVEHQMSSKNVHYITLYLQFLFIILLAIFAIISIYIKELVAITYLFMSLTLLIMSYNNKTIYHKYGMSLATLIFGIILFITSVYYYLGAI